jgi:hypothetical protein
VPASDRIRERAWRSGEPHGRDWDGLRATSSACHRRRPCSPHPGPDRHVEGDSPFAHHASRKPACTQGLRGDYAVRADSRRGERGRDRARDAHHPEAGAPPRERDSAAESLPAGSVESSPRADYRTVRPLLLLAAQPAVSASPLLTPRSKGAVAAPPSLRVVAWCGCRRSLDTTAGAAFMQV